MPVFIQASTDPFTVEVEYVKDSLGNTVAVNMPIEVWNKIISRYRTIFVNEELEDVVPGE